MVAADASRDATVPAEDQAAGSIDAARGSPAAAPLDRDDLLRTTALHNLGLLSTEALVSLIAFAVWTLTSDEEDDDAPPDLLLSDDDADQLLRAIRGLAIIQQVLGDEEVGGL